MFILPLATTQAQPAGRSFCMFSILLMFFLPVSALAQDPEQLYSNLVEVIADGNFEVGEAQAQLAVSWARRLSDSDPASAIRLLNSAGVFYIHLGEVGIASELLEDAVGLSQRAYGDGHPLVISSLSNLGVAYRSLGHLGEAREKIEEALRWGLELYGASHPRIGEIRNNLAAILLGSGEHEQAIVEASTAISIGSGGDELEPEWRIAARTNLGIAQMATGALDAAIESVIKANESAEASGNRLILAEARTAVGQVYSAIGDQERAAAAFDLAAADYSSMGVPARRDALALPTMTIAADSLEDGVADLAQQIVAKSAASERKTLAVSAFPHADDTCSELSNYLVDELVLSLFDVGDGRLQIIERSQLARIFAELELSMSGAIDANTTKELARIYGVDSLLIGSLTVLGDRLRVISRLIETETGQVFSAAATNIPKTATIVSLMERPAAAGCTMAPGPRAAAGGTMAPGPRD